MAIIIDNIAPLSGDAATDLQTVHSYLQYMAEAINAADDARKHKAAEKMREVTTNG